MDWVLQRCQFTNMVASEARGFSGGLWCIWNNTLVDVQCLNCTTEILNLLIRTDGQFWLLSLVYASPIVVIRDELCDYIEMHNFVKIPWLLKGNFNQVTKPEDKRDGWVVSGYPVERMRLMLNVCNLLELSFSGPRLTWDNKNRHTCRFSIQQRLDQSWANQRCMIFIQMQESNTSQRYIRTITRYFSFLMKQR